MVIWNLMKKEVNKTLTENDALTYKSTESKVLDLFAMGGALRKREPKEIEKMLSLALAEDKTLAIKCLFYLRDCRGGQGERRTFRESLKILSDYYPEETKKILPLIPYFGRWDDLFYLDNVEIDGILKEQLKKDMISDNPSLLAKWLKSENASSKETKEIARLIRKDLGLSSKNYRKTLTILRKKIGIVETKMSSNQWDEIDYAKNTSKVNLIYKDAFKKHDEKRYNQYLESVTKGEATINTGTLFPYEIVRKCRDKSDKTLEVLWENLPDYTNNNEKAIVVADVSGSMSGLPMDVSVSLAMYFAERNEGIFKNKFITFSSKPLLQEITGGTLSQKIRNLERANWEMNTNLQGVFDLLLDTAVENKVLDVDLPKTIYIISDMEFDDATCDYCNYDDKRPKETNFEIIKQKYAEAGYKMPNLVFWNVDSRQNNVPCKQNDEGIMLVSGCSASTFKMAVQKTNPYNFMLQVLNSERYQAVEDALNDKIVVEEKSKTESKTEPKEVNSQQPGDKPNIQGGDDCTDNNFGFDSDGTPSKKSPADTQEFKSVTTSQLRTLSRERFDEVMISLKVKRPIKCQFCGDEITKDNFAFIKKSIKACNKKECLRQAVILNEANNLINQ